MIRWLRWNLVCWRGRRCADLIVDTSVSPLADVPPGASIRMWFDCGVCGTKYFREAMVTSLDSVVHLDRVRVGERGARTADAGDR